MNVLRSVVPNQAWLLKGSGVVLSIGGLLFRLYRTPAPPRRRPRSLVLAIRGKAGDASLTKFTYRRRTLPSQSVGKSPRNRFRKARNQGPDLQTRPHGNKPRLRQRIRKSCSSRHRPREPS